MAVSCYTAAVLERGCFSKKTGVYLLCKSTILRIGKQDMKNKQQDIQGSMKEDLLNLLRGSLLQDTAPSDVHLTTEKFDALLKLAKKHEVQPIAAYALLFTGGLTDEQEQRCRKLVYTAMVYHQRMDQELKRICALLEAAGFDYMPLKGAVIRNLYPEPWMRTSGDIDILVKNVDEAADLLVERGYVRGEKSAHDITLTSPGGIQIELHYLLIEKQRQVNDLLKQVWEYAIPRTGSRHYELKPEMLYYYHIVHMAKHMLLGGCGIRFFMDTWLLNKTLPLDEEKKRQLLQEGGMAAFAQQAEHLGQVWFGDRQPNPVTLELEAFILNGGVFGSKSNEIKLRRTKANTLVKFLFLRIFPPYKRMAIAFPVLEKYPFLLPVFWIRRWSRLLLKDGKRRSAVQELTLNQKTDDVDVAATKWLFEELELL